MKIMQDGVCENFTAAMLSPYLDAHGARDVTEAASQLLRRPAAAEGRRHPAIDAPGLPGAFPRHRGRARSVRRSTRCRPPAAPTGPARAAPHFASAGCPPGRPAPVPGTFGDSQLPAALGVQRTPDDRAHAAFPRPGAGRLAVPFGSLSRSGAQLCFGSDWPVSSPNPLWEIHTAVNRRSRPATLRGAAGRSALLAVRADRPRHRARGLHHRLRVRQPRRARDRLDRGGQWPTRRRSTGTCSACPPWEIALAQVDYTIVDGAVVYGR